MENITNNDKKAEDVGEKPREIVKDTIVGEGRYKVKINLTPINTNRVVKK